MKQIFRKGFELLTSAPAVILPVLAFLIVSEIVRSPSGEIGIHGEIGIQLLSLISNPILVAIVGAAFAIKMISVFFSNADMYLAYEGRPDRYGLIARKLGLRWLTLLLVASLTWTAAFCLFGLAVILAAEAYLSRPAALIVILVIGLPLFPLYYLGISLGSLTAIAARLDDLRVPTLVRRGWESRLRVYKYYAFRSVIDQSIVLGIPALVAIMVPSRIAGIGITIILVALCISYIRASFMAFKRNVLLGR